MEHSDVLALLGEELGAVCETGGVDSLRDEHVVQYRGEIVGSHV